MRDQRTLAEATAVAAAAVKSAAGAGEGRMRAWRLHAYGTPRDLRLEEARVPPLRDPKDVLVRVQAASINPIDIHMIGGYGARAMNMLRRMNGGEGVEFPLVPGCDFVGEVERAGADSHVKPGQRVWGVVPPYRQGSLAQYVLVKDEWVGPAPPTLDDAAAGGALYAALTALAALRAGALDDAAGKRVLVFGLGGVGQAALQLLAARKAHVVVGCSAALGPRARALGAAAAPDRHAPDYHQQLAAHGPYDVVLDCAGLGGDAPEVKRWSPARYVTLSSPLLHSMDARGLALGALSAGASLLAQSVRARTNVRWAFFSANAADIEHVRRLAERGQFSVYVEAVFPWWKADEAFARAIEGGARGKVVLDFKAPAPDSQAESPSAAESASARSPAPAQAESAAESASARSASPAQAESAAESASARSASPAQAE